MDRGESDVNEIPTTQAIIAAVGVLVGALLGWLARRKK